MGDLKVQRCKTLSFEMFETKNALDGIDAIYWINLDRATDRHDSMIKLLSDESFDNIAKFRITAVDGKNPDIVNDKFYDMSNKSDSPTDYEYACLFSHLDSIRKFSESEYNLGLILEDDVTLEFKPYWKETIRDIINDAPSDWEIIMLWYNVHDGGFIDSKFVKQYGQHYYALSYLINKKGAQRLMSDILKDGKYFLEPSINSHRADTYLYEKLTTYIYKFPYFVYRTENDSYLHPEHLRSHVLDKNNALRAYAAI